MADLELHYFPFYAKDWLSGEGTTAMTPEAKGGFIDLLAHSWLSDPPCTLPDNDAILSRKSGLGRRWRACSSAIRSQFEMVDGRLRNPKLYSIYLEVAAAHEARVASGRLGGKAKAKAKQAASKEASETVAEVELSSSNQSQRQSQNQRQSAQEESALPAQAGALSSPGSLGEEAPPPTIKVRSDGETKRLILAYEDRISRGVMAWKVRHGEEYLALIEEAGALYPDGSMPPASLERAVTQAVAERVRAINKWPTFAEWLALQDESA